MAPGIGDVEAIVELPFGSISGNMLVASREFLGVPFAPKPARFASARLWTDPYPGGHFEAKHYTPVCAQISAYTPGLPVFEVSEDCLHLTIYTPRQDHNSTGGQKEARDGPWPVMLYIHGGSLWMGSAMAPNYNASVLSARGRVVVAAANYRLGPLGFATVQADTAVGASSTVSNQGFRDQRLAMSWLRLYVGAFGGNPSRITIFGESAGGQSVQVHFVSSGSRGLFDAAIIQSGIFDEWPSVDDGKLSTDRLARSLGCIDHRDLLCLQRVPWFAVVNASMPWGMSSGFGLTGVIDGDVLEGNPLELAFRGEFNRVPLLMGNLKDEGNAFFYPPWFLTEPASANVFECLVRANFGAKASAILDVYTPVHTQGIDHRFLVSQMFTDRCFRCPSHKFSRALAQEGLPPWVYVFNRHPKCLFADWYGFSEVPGAAHGDDIQYVFNNIEWLIESISSESNRPCTPSEQDLKLADTVSDIWADFAKYGNATWPRFELRDEQSLRIDSGTVTRLETEMGNGRFEFDFWESLAMSNYSSFNWLDGCGLFPGGMSLYASSIRSASGSNKSGEQSLLDASIRNIDVFQAPLAGIGALVVSAAFLTMRRRQQVSSWDSYAQIP